jgi:hypothetical protein
VAERPSAVSGDVVQDLPTFSIAGFRASVDAYALECPDRSDEAWLWFVSLLGPQQSVKALWARLLKGELATLHLAAFGRTRFCRLAPEGPKSWRFHSATLPAASGYQGVLVPDAARAAAERPDFVLLPRTEAEAAVLHQRFLNRRVDLPLLPAWADWLWARAKQCREAVPLVSYGLAAYRCRPDPDGLATDLSQAVRRGSLPVPNEQAPIDRLKKGTPR